LNSEQFLTQLEDLGGLYDLNKDRSVLEENGSYTSHFVDCSVLRVCPDLMWTCADSLIHRLICVTEQFDQFMNQSQIIPVDKDSVVLAYELGRRSGRPVCPPSKRGLSTCASYDPGKRFDIETHDFRRTRLDLTKTVCLCIDHLSDKTSEDVMMLLNMLAYHCEETYGKGHKVRVFPYLLCLIDSRRDKDARIYGKADFTHEVRATSLCQLEAKWFKDKEELEESEFKHHKVIKR
jgi:hypothetical protein